MTCRKCHADVLDGLDSCPQCGYVFKPEDDTVILDLDGTNESDYRKTNGADSSVKSMKYHRKITPAKLIRLVGILALIALGIYLVIKDIQIKTETREREKYLAISRNMDTDELEEGFTNVYADVIEFCPWYVVSRKNESIISTGYVCRCKTVKGKTVWVYAPKADLKYSITLPYSEKKSNTYRYPSDDPLRLKGTLVKVDDIGEGSHAAIDDGELILKIDKYPVAYDERPGSQEYLNIQRNMDTDKLEDGFKNVYADVVSIGPWITLTDSRYRNTEIVTGVIFKCETVQGKQIWAYMHVGGTMKDFVMKQYPARLYSSDHPYRLNGSIVTAEDLALGLSSKIDFSKFVLKIEKYPN